MKNCIFFVINNRYTPFLSVLISSLKQYSHNIFQLCDFIIYHDGLEKNNIDLLSELVNNRIEFIIMKDNDFPKEMMNHPHITSSRWGKYILYKLYGFELVKKYDHCLFLDADMLVRRPLDDIFDCKEIAWREALWCSNIRKASYSCPNGGVLFFTKKLLKYKINNDDILNSFNSVYNIDEGSIEERIIGQICFNKKIKITLLDIKYNAWFTYERINDAVIVHFIQNRIMTSYKCYFMFYD